MDVRIYRPEKSAMQSGRAKTGIWILECELPTARVPEPLMGWVSSGDTLNQIRMKFDTVEEAIALAEKNGWAYTVQPEQERKIVPRSYIDNFRYNPPKE